MRIGALPEGMVRIETILNDPDTAEILFGQNHIDRTLPQDIV